MHIASSLWGNKSSPPVPHDNPSANSKESTHYVGVYEESKYPFKAVPKKCDGVHDIYEQCREYNTKNSLYKSGNCNSEWDNFSKCLSE